ncbi:short-chain dehydrogenase/reductase-like protein sdr [Calycina marina]|uniref:Short-chain dehydrogenase/reductase-like protein sdr n=1 Tax=Calycina marina TaxID=1763456 RepID=A0A9P7Z704_9HELO|nr:short-chain dehydrogenase/reductase-like protein sdr [Calycina marina]
MQCYPTASPRRYGLPQVFPTSRLQLLSDPNNYTLSFLLQCPTKMPYDFKGKKVLVTGGSRGLGEYICVKFAKEGCNVAINYVSSVDRANAVAEKVEDHGVRACLIQGDMGIEADVKRTVETAIEILGGLDIIISNAGYTRFSKFDDLSAATVDDWQTTYAVNVLAQRHLLFQALPIFNSNPHGGVMIMSSSIAGIKTSGSSMPYSVTKAAQLHLMKCLAATQGPKVRVNAVLPGLLLTEWGLRYPQERIDQVTEAALLKKATDLDDCAQAFVDIARNTSMTGQSVVVDSGLSAA